MSEVLQVIKDPKLTFNQRFSAMAKAAENSIDPIVVSKKTQEYINKGMIFDMYEGKAPYRPRYIIPDYDKFMKNGSKFLMLEQPKDIWEAISNLMIMYHHVPSASNLPVYIGHLDRLLEPFVKDISYEEAYKAIKMLLTHVDRTIPDAFCHCNIGPYDTVTGRIILDLSAEMQRPVPNMSMIYNEHTPDEFALKAIEVGLLCGKPSFVNDRVYSSEWGSSYAVASCYNVLPIGGGGLTLGRINLKKVAEYAQSKEEFLNTLLPEATLALCELMDERVKFIIEEAEFFNHIYLVDEGLISQEKFISMFGLVGLAECVNLINHFTEQSQRFGHGEEATAFGEQVLDSIKATIETYQPKYGKILMHAQVGVDSDEATTPGTRIPVAEEVEMFDHLAVTARLQKHFVTGTGDIYPFDETVKKNPQYVLDIIKGAFNMNTRYISFYGSDCDVVRVTGYLVKRSDMERYGKGEAVLDNATCLGYGVSLNNYVMDREVRHFNND